MRSQFHRALRFLVPESAMRSIIERVITGPFLSFLSSFLGKPANR